jgi:hypothetical protein
MDTIKLTTENSELFFSNTEGVFQTIDDYLQTQGYKSAISKFEIDGFTDYMREKLETSLVNLKRSSRLKLGRMKRVKYKEGEYELNLSEPDHFTVYTLLEVFRALEQTKTVAISYNEKP